MHSLADVPAFMMKRFGNAWLSTVGTNDFHPLLPLSTEALEEEKTRIRDISDPKLREALGASLESVEDLRDTALAEHEATLHDKTDGDISYKHDLNAMVLTLKALGVS